MFTHGVLGITNIMDGAESFSAVDLGSGSTTILVVVDPTVVDPTVNPGA
jgi:hypothetical protein